MFHSHCIQFITLLAIALTSFTAHAQPNDDIPPATAKNVPYGDHPNQVIDFWQADVEGPAPLVIYIHGGAFRNNPRNSSHARMIKPFLDAGFHHASIEYRFLQHAMFPAPQEDVIRALQFIRSKADEWGIDKTRIGAYGGSAGAQLVAYLGWTKDFADPDSDDPIARESSRLKAIVLMGGQATLDFDWWAENIPGYKRSYHKRKEDGMDVSEVELRAMIHELSVINHISPDDPPTFMSYGMKPDAPVPSDPKRARGWSVHHVNFGVAMEEKLKEAGVEAHLKYPGANVPFDSGVDFLIHHLKQ